MVITAIQLFMAKTNNNFVCEIAAMDGAGLAKCTIGGRRPWSKS